MKKIINGKKYDTETATEVCEWSEGYVSDLRYVEETLFRKKTGEYFLHGYGGAASRYAQRIEDNNYEGGSAIIPLSYEAARKWAEDHMPVEIYEAEFGEVSEGAEGVRQITARVSEAAAEKLRRMSSATGDTQSAILERLIIGAEL